MYYHRARYYSQSLRRFIQEDPVEGSTSPYAYVHGSPLEATDPSGMMDSWEMLQRDPREAQLTMAQGPSTMVEGVPYDGHGLWLDGLGAGGGAQIQQINVFGTGTTRTQSEQSSAGLLPRKLTLQEISRLGNLCDATDCFRIQVYDGWIPQGTGLTIGYTIFMGKPVTSNGASSYFGTLAHEVMHTVPFTHSCWKQTVLWLLRR
jgi:hypothetical protein